MSDLVLRLGAVFLLVFLNGFFVAAEYALVSVRRTRIQELIEQGSNRAENVMQALQDLNRTISAVQVGVTMASLALGWLGEPAVSAIIRPALLQLGFGEGAIHTAAILIGFFVITYLHVVVGEIVPKAIALHKTEKTIMWAITPLRVFALLVSPFVWAFSKGAEAILKVLKIPLPGGHHIIHSEEELKMLVSQSSQGGVLQEEEQEMLYNVFEFADKDVQTIMVPRPDICAMPIDVSAAQFIQLIAGKPYTRFPVYEGNERDNIVGVLHLRDIFDAITNEGLDTLQIKHLVRPAHIVPESKSLAQLLTDFRRTKNHMAIVVDEYGSVAGLVTMEDLLEQIVGEIDDEHDQPERLIEVIADNHLILDGMYPVEDLNERWGIELDPGDYHTVGGLVFGHLGRQPLDGDEILIEKVKFTVLETEGSRVLKVEVKAV